MKWHEFDAPDIPYVDSYIFDGTPCPRCHKPVLYNRWEFEIDGEDVCFTLDFQEDTYFSKTVPYEALRLAALRDLWEVRDDPETVAGTKKS